MTDEKRKFYISEINEYAKRHNLKLEVDTKDYIGAFNCEITNINGKIVFDKLTDITKLWDYMQKLDTRYVNKALRQKFKKQLNGQRHITEYIP